MNRWFRHLMARIAVMNEPEWGGMMYDYDNGRWKLLLTWQGKEWEGAGDLLDNMWNRGQDAIYVVTVKVAAKSGYFVVSDSNRSCSIRFFYQGVYEAKEAYADVTKYCRKVADKMGFRRPENAEGVQS